MVWTWGRGGRVEHEESGIHNPGCIWTDRVCVKKRGSERESEREGEEKTGKQTEGNALQGSVRQRERESSWKERRRRLNKRGQALVRWCVSDKKKGVKAKIWENPYSRHFFSCSVSKRSTECANHSEENKEIVDGNASLGRSPIFLSVSLYSALTTDQGGWMREEGAPHTLNLFHAEAQTHTSASCTHTGGPMQLQDSADTEEKKVS